MSHISDTDTIVRGPFTSQLWGTKRSKEKEKAEGGFCCLSSEPCEVAGPAGIPTWKQNLGTDTDRNPKAARLLGHGSFPYCKADLINGIYFRKFPNSQAVDDTCIPEGLSSTFLNANSTL